MADTPTAPDANKALTQEKAQAEATKLPESIRRDAPKQSYEMPGPLGAAMRNKVAQIVFAKDYIHIHFSP